MTKKIKDLASLSIGTGARSLHNAKVAIGQTRVGGYTTDECTEMLQDIEDALATAQWLKMEMQLELGRAMDKKEQEKP
jgi:hypothetical protein